MLEKWKGALNRLVAHATLSWNLNYCGNSTSCFAGFIKISNKKITIEEIQKRVAEHFNIRLTDMHSPQKIKICCKTKANSNVSSKINNFTIFTRNW